MVVVYLFAVVGAAGVALWIAGRGASAWRVFRATQEFQAASAAALTAIREYAPSDPRDHRVFLALSRWEASRSAIRALTEDQQRIVGDTLRDRGFPVSDVVEAIMEFVEVADRETRELDDQLRPIAAASRT